MPLKHQVIVGIDLIRFFASSIVMLYHLCYWIWAAPPDSSTRLAAGSYVEFPELVRFSFGAVGVPIFFVVSGFIITYSAQGVTAYQFFRSRLVRLMPAIWICAPITLFMLMAVDAGPLMSLAASFLRSVLLSPVGPWVDGIYWTLPIEVMFYSIVFALLLFARLRWLEYVMGLVGVASAAFWLSQAMGYEPISNNILLLNILQLRHGCLFALGVYLWLILFDRFSSFRLALIMFFIAGGLLYIGPRLASLIWILAILAIVVSVRFNSFLGANKKFSSMSRILGLTTYPLYLIHNVVGAALLGFLFRSGFNRFAALGISLVVMLLAAATIAVWVEPRVQARLRSGLDRLVRFIKPNRTSTNLAESR